MEQSHIGIKGHVTDENGNPIGHAVIAVFNVTNGHYLNHDVTSYSSGEYWRLLIDGDYKVTASAPGYESVTHDVHVEFEPRTEAQRVDFELPAAGEAAKENKFSMYKDDQKQDYAMKQDYNMDTLLKALKRYWKEEY